MRFFMLALLAAALAQPPLPAAPRRIKTTNGHLLCENFGTDDGLPANTIFAIRQTRDGSLWLGTRQGLSRFDGVGFTNFDRTNTPVMPGNSIAALAEDAEGALWAGFEHGGVAVFRAGRFEAVDGGARVPPVRSMTAAPDGSVWIATRKGLWKWDRGAGMTQVPLPEGDPPLYSIVLVPDGRAWLGTEKSGLVELWRGQVRPVVSPLELPARAVSGLCFDSRGRLWVGTESGAAVLHEGRLRTVLRERGSGNQVVTALLEDRKGSVWIGAWNRLLRTTGMGFSEIPLAREGHGNQITALYQDREGSIWAGMENEGLFRLNESTVGVFTRQEGLPHDSVKTVRQDSSGSLWVGTDDGLSVIRNDRASPPEAALEVLRHNWVRSVHEDSQGVLWFGTRAGLFRYERGKIREIRPDGANAPLSVFVLAGGGEDLWVGALGLRRLRHGVWHPGPREFDGVVIRALLPDSRGRLWVGTHEKGVCRVGQDGIRCFSAREGLSGREMTSLYLDSEGVVWAGTLYDGLNRIEGDRIRSFGRSAGFEDGVYQILEDDAGYLWLGGGKGIYRVERRALSDWLGGKGAVPAVSTYGIGDGIPSSECSSGQQPGAWKARDGRLWFSTVRGAVVIDPRMLPVNRPSAPVSVLRLSVDGSVKPLDSDLSFPPGPGNVELQYATQTLRGQGETAYRYRLLGLSEGWLEAGTRRAAYYANLPAGRYTFEVVARGSDGMWGDSTARIRFELRPHFYRTVWFYSLGGALAGCGVLLTYLGRMRRMRAEFAATLAERNRIAREIHDTLLQGVAGVSAHLEAITTILAVSPETAAKQLERLRKLTRGVVDDARRRIWDLRSGGAPGDLAAKLTAIANSTFESKMQVDVVVAGQGRALCPKVEEALLRIAQEAIVNSTKHSGGTRIHVEAQFERNAVSLLVADDGKGMAAGVEGKHFGLLGMEERAREVGAKFRIRSRPGAGTEIIVSVPLRKWRRSYSKG